MNNTRVKLKGSLENVTADIRGIEHQGKKVYPAYPEGYEIRNGTKVFVVTPPAQEVITPGGEDTPPVLSEYFVSYLILPADCDISFFQTSVVEN